MANISPRSSLRRDVFFIDASLPDLFTLTSALPVNAEIHLIDAAQDGLEQIALTLRGLEGESGIDAIHIFSHGSAGELSIGSTRLSSYNINSYASTLLQIGSSLSPSGDILLYGCNVGAGAEGLAFVESVARLTQADVAASDDVTGSAALGGDWVLEVESGVVEDINMGVDGYDGILELTPITISFEPRVDYPAGNGPYAVNSSDINGDGNIDLITGNFYGNNISFLQNNGNGTFSSKIDTTVGANPHFVNSVDINNDKYIDLIVPNAGSNTVSVLINNSDGKFPLKQENYPAGNTPTTITFMDVNNDYFQDVIVVNQSSNTLSILINNGDGILALKDVYPTGTYPIPVISTDVNNDGILDLVVGNANSGNISVFMNNGNATFASKVDYPSGSYSRSIISMDVNNDKYTDLVVANSFSNNLSILINNRDGTFITGDSYPTEFPEWIATADLNNDNKNDIIVANGNNDTISILLNNGDGTFALKLKLTTGSHPDFVITTDLNKDSKPDIVVTNFHSNDVSVFLNNTISNETFIGHPGDDTYNVDSTGDKVIEKPNEGNDTVNSSISYVLPANVENLNLTGTAAINGFGNSLWNTMTGNSAANELYGGAGNDTLIGVGGNDTLNGGSGDDTYVIDSAGYKIVEEKIGLSGGIDDWVESSISYTLPANIESLKLTGLAEINGYGNKLNNLIYGNDAANIFNGYAGDDTIDGCGGIDTVLYNGIADDYKIETLSNGATKVTDRNPSNGSNGTDLLFSIENIQFTDLGKPTGTGIKETNPFLTLALFAEAAYDSSNDPYVAVAQKTLTQQGWQFIHPIRHQFVQANDMFTNENAAALVAVKGDSLVVSFRGTDFDGETLLEQGRDALHWVAQGSHYDLFKDLAASIKEYATDATNGIKKIYVTGHSLGAVMATWYLTDDVNGGNYFESTKLFDVFGASFAPPEALGWWSRDFTLNDKIEYYRFENARDIVPDIVQFIEYTITKLITNFLGSKFMDLGMGRLAKLTGDNIDEMKTVVMQGLGKFIYGGKTANDAYSNYWNKVYDKTIGQIIDNNALALDWLGENPGKQINMATTDFLGYLGAFTSRHSMTGDYFQSLQLLDNIGLIDDFDFVSRNTKLFGGVIENNEVLQETYDPITLRTSGLYGGITDLVGDDSFMKQSAQTVLDVASWAPSLVGTLAGFFDNKREFGTAEQYTENHIVIGSMYNDKLIGDAGGSGEGTDDVFYIGTGTDRVYGHQTWDDNGGIDTVVYKFSDTLIAQRKISDGSVPKDIRHNIDSYWDDKDHAGGLDQVIINIDGSPDTLFDIEKLHFIDSASDAINLLAGTSGNDIIDSKAGNDYLFGGAGNDTLTGGNGNDRIHGGDGMDTAVFDAGSYTFKVINFALEVTNIKTREIDTLYSVEKIQIADSDPYDVARTIAYYTKFGSASNLSDSQKLLLLYAPIFGYKGSDADNLTVYGRTVENTSGKITALQYELREIDNYLNPDDHWYVELLLGDDYLLKSIATILDEASTSVVDPTAQVRNIWDTDIEHISNHPFIYLDLGKAGAHLTPEIKPAHWLIPQDQGIKNGTPYTLKFEGLQDTDFDYRSNSDTNDDIYESDLYEIDGNPHGQVQLVGLPSGDMEMGFLFAGTNLQNLGHFDLV